MKNKETLVQESQEKIINCDQTIKRLTKKINAACAVLLKHILTLKNKASTFDKYRELITEGHFNAGRTLWENELCFSIRRKENKTMQIEEMLEELKYIKNLQKQLKQEIVFVTDFNPLEEQKKQITETGLFQIATNEEWKTLSRSKIKTFQETFSPPGLRVIPQNTSINLDFENCIVDPARIPTAFLEEVGIASFPKDLSPLAILIKKSTTITEIKHLFRNTENMSLEGPRNARYDNYRLLVIQQREEHNGKIIYTRFAGSKPTSLETKIITIFNSAYEALRKIGHQRDKYKKEGNILQTALTSLKNINLILGTIEKNDLAEYKISILNEAKQELLEELEKLQNCTNYLKKEAKEILALITEIKDQRGQINPPAIRTRIVRIQNLLRRRVYEKKYKSDYLNGDEAVLTDAIAQGESTLEEFTNRYKNLFKQVEIAKNATLFKQENDSPIQKQQCQNFLTLVQRILGQSEELEELKVRPFNLFSQKLMILNQAILEAIKKQDYLELKAITDKALLICQIFQQKEKLNNLLVFFHNDHHIISLSSLAKMIESLIKLSPTKEIHQKLNQLTELTKSTSDKKQSNTKREEFLEEIKQSLKKIDTEIDTVLDTQ